MVNGNFGCGSSREHAPQAIAKWGIRAIVGESFAEIFFGNCLTMGVPCVVADPSVTTELQRRIAADPSVIVEVDVANRRVRCGDYEAEVTLANGPYGMLTTGQWDATGQLVANAADIRATAAQLPYIAWAN